MVESLKEAGNLEIIKAIKEIILLAAADKNVGESRNISLVLKCFEFFELILSGNSNMI
jgi:hypothetical protein